MNQTSPMNTATAAGAAAVLMPIVAYIASLMNLKPPAEVLSSVVVLLVAGAHWVGQVIAARTAARAPAAPLAAVAAGQGGFVAWSMLWILAPVALAAAVLSACTTAPGAAPNAAQVQQIENACAIDAGLRPAVSAALAIPGLAKPEEIAAVVAARAVIDPICANPAGNIQANAISAVTSASASVVGILAQLQARKAAPTAAAAAAK